ncbi:hypothetical protein EDB92DRAFT_523788 [Lactarius akahatsu]|uniref:Uncharacterized protein n=1 Tax=Lactarius akahatsu TaxID=416441 RepID=A0AAD4LII3_9AGAM|nr:hypothetical protein EDB92DRAFT_523788 [Lactarius akahatsu]
MVYTFLSNRTQVQRTNNVLNLLAIYSINCGTLHLVFTISCITLLPKYRDTLIYLTCIFVMTRLYPCAFMSILKSDNLRETLDGPEGGVVTFTRLNVRTATTVPYGAQGATEANTNTAVPKSLPPASVSSGKSLDVIVFNREKYYSRFDGVSGP